MSISSPAAVVGSKVTITCNFDQYTKSGTATIAWYKDTKDFTDEMKKHVSLGDNCGDIQRSRYIIDSTKVDNTGKYKCKATYTINAKPVAVEPEAEKGFFVRKVSTIRLYNRCTLMSSFWLSSR